MILEPSDVAAITGTSFAAGALLVGSLSYWRNRPEIQLMLGMQDVSDGLGSKAELMIVLSVRSLRGVQVQIEQVGLKFLESDELLRSFRSSVRNSPAPTPTVSHTNEAGLAPARGSCALPPMPLVGYQFVRFYFEPDEARRTGLATPLWGEARLGNGKTYRVAAPALRRLLKRHENELRNRVELPPRAAVPEDHG